MTAVAHVGLTVADLDEALAWYRDVLGLAALAAPVEVRAHEGHAGTVAADVFGSDFGAFRQAHLASANGTAIELFEFAGPPPEPLFHVCFVTPEVERAADRIEAHGGRRRTRAWEIFAGEPYLTCWCDDPFGNRIELYSHSHERTYANRRNGA